MTAYTYDAKIEKDEDGRYVVIFPSLPYGATDGETFSEALDNAYDCLEEILSGMIKNGDTLPYNHDNGTNRITVNILQE